MVSASLSTPEDLRDEADLFLAFPTRLVGIRASDEALVARAAAPTS